jgi:hypothetical protein
MRRRWVACSVALLALAVSAGCGRGSDPASGTEAGGGVETAPAGGGSAAPANRSPIDVPASLTGADRAAAELAVRALTRECNLQSQWSLIASSQVEVKDEIGYRYDELDWYQSVQITLKVKDGIPRSGGHSLLYYLGAGKRPGIITTKQVAKELCGFFDRAKGLASGGPCGPDADEDCILEVPELAALDQGRPPAAANAAPGKEPVPVFCFGYGFDPPQFWTCTSTRAQCDKLRKIEKREENGDYRVRTVCRPTKAAHCFKSLRTACAPTVDACVESRKEYLKYNEASTCEPATAELVTESLKKD